MRVSLRSTSKPAPVIANPALVVGHPGHELKVFGWMTVHRPRLYVITDGSGRHGVSRISSTARLLATLGSRQGEIFGNMSDAEIYAAMLSQNSSVFFELLEELVASFLTHQIDCVVGDAAEGFNPTHDICRVLIDAAVMLVERRSGIKIANYEVSLTEWERGCPQPRHDDQCVHWVLDDPQLAGKIAAARQYVELKAEVERAIQQRGKEYFRLECFRRTEGTPLAHFADCKPAYESWGEQRVAQGQYDNVIRFQKHILPMMDAILDYSRCVEVEELSPLAGD